MFNLCSEKTYDTSFFHGRVERVLIDDHNVPSLKQMLEFADKVSQFVFVFVFVRVFAHINVVKNFTGPNFRAKNFHKTTTQNLQISMQIIRE